MTDIVWEDPPEDARFAGKAGHYTEFAVALKQRPGQWAVLPGDRASTDSAKNTAQNLRTGRMKGFEKGAWETAVHGTKVFVRYTPPTEAGAVSADGDEPVAVGDRAYKASAVRAWARDNGFQIADRGVIAANVIAAFEEAQEPDAEDS